MVYIFCSAIGTQCQLVRGGVKTKNTTLLDFEEERPRAPSDSDRGGQGLSPEEFRAELQSRYGTPDTRDASLRKQVNSIVLGYLDSMREGDDGDGKDD